MINKSIACDEISDIGPRQSANELQSLLILELFEFSNLPVVNVNKR